MRKDERKDLHKSRRGRRGDVRTYPHIVCALGSCCRNCRQHGLGHGMLRKGRNGAQKQVLWQSAGEKAAQHLAPGVSNLVKFQPVDINNLQFMLC